MEDQVIEKIIDDKRAAKVAAAREAERALCVCAGSGEDHGADR